jgi:hypothetical protein
MAVHVGGRGPGHLARVGSRAWTPASLFANGEDGCWLDPSDATSLFQNSNGTGAVTATSDPVGRISDKSGRGKHLTQATAGARPTWNSAGYIQTDGSSQYIYTTSIPWTSAWTLIAAFQSTSTAAGRLFGRDTYQSLFDANDGTATWYASGSTTAVPIARQPRNLPHILTHRRTDDSTAIVRWDGYQVASFNPTEVSNVDYLVIGAQTIFGATKGAVRCYGLVLVNRALTDVEVQQAEAYFTGKIAGAQFSSPCDVFVIAGQSNTYFGATLDSGIDVSNASTYEFTQAQDIIAANDPLDTFVGRNSGKIGFAMEFARQYVTAGQLAAGRKILLVHCGLGGTGFSSSLPDSWSAGSGSLRDRTIARAKAALVAAPGSVLKGLLWHQGESDAAAGGTAVSGYAANLDGLISDFRSSVVGAGNAPPVVVGGMVPGYVALNGADYATVQAALAATGSRNSRAAYVDPTGLGTTDIHFSAADQRTLGQRYYTAWAAL